jgi:hypothetical protein
LRHHHADLLTSLLGILNRGRCNKQYGKIHLSLIQ